MSRGTGFPARGFGTGRTPSVLSVPSCHKSFRTLRGRLNASRYDRRSAVAPTWAGKPMPRGTGFPARGFGTEPPCARPSSALRFLRSLLSKILPCVPWANPPPSVLRRPPLLPRGASTKDRRVCPLFQSLSFSAFLFFTYRNSGVTKPASKKWRSVVNTVCRRISLIITMLEQSTNE